MHGLLDGTLRRLAEVDGAVLVPARTACIVGMGEVGRRLGTALRSAGWEIHPVGRDVGWRKVVDAANPALRLVAVREEDLEGVLQRIPSSARARLVLVQNGFLEAVHGPLGPVTRGLIYFTSKAEFFEVLCPSVFHGPLAASLVPALARGGIPCLEETDERAFLQAMVVKGIWNVVVGLPLAVHGVDLETYLREHRAEWTALVEESARAAAAQYGVDLDATVALEKIRTTTSSLGWVRGGAKALPWRNGAIARFGRRHGVATPVNDRLLRESGFDPDSGSAGSSQLP